MVYADGVRSPQPSKDPTVSRGVIGLHPPHWGSHTAGACVLNPCVAGIRNPEVATRQQVRREESVAKKMKKVESDSTNAHKPRMPPAMATAHRQ